MAGAVMFSKLDQNNGFWQAKLNANSKLLTTFITPFGKYCYLRVPFVSVGSSSYGLGAILRQVQNDQTVRVVACSSRTLTKTDRGYAQIEKGALACAWGCERFSDFITGIQFTLETDHKPLLSIMKIKLWDELRPRLLGFRMRLMRYTYNIVYVPGKELIPADVLSRKPLDNLDKSDLEEEMEAQGSMLMSNIPSSEKKIQEIFQAQQLDPICNKLHKYICEGWPKFKVIHTHDFQKFAQEYEFQHVTSSPMYAQSNGFIEAMVKTIKNEIKKETDMQRLLLEYRSSPLSKGFSPAELLFGRKIRTKLPRAPMTLKPDTVPYDVLLEKENHRIENQKRNFDAHHGAKELLPLQQGEKVWIQDKRKWGKWYRNWICQGHM
ncbi:unnamed protein product [Allacma fusca]|uniref:Integrase catalytic domain-containing protein n=1 Tax=Allacma fusca TaxID=39272 RepID=A0A8J2LMX9_9HEXA|nr:unnamed protein product [Allacma fusca]